MYLTGKIKLLLTLTVTVLPITNAYCEIVEKTFTEYRNQLIITSQYKADVVKKSPQYKKFFELRQVIPRPRLPNALVSETSLGKDKILEYKKFYSLDRYGFRISPIKKDATENLIIAGDSNIFGVGCNDDETLTAQLSAKIKQAQLTNLGMAASAPNSFYYFLKNSSLSDILPDTTKPGVMIYDFNFYLFERIIGSKNFISWGENQPAYEVINEELKFIGQFKDLWRTKFYQTINTIDPEDKLFKNLPHLSEGHLELTTKLFIEIKKEFQQQTKKDNSFIISINPFYIEKNEYEYIKKLVLLLKKSHIDVMEFQTIQNPTQYRYGRDGHLTPSGQKYYAELISEKLPIFQTKKSNEALQSK